MDTHRIEVLDGTDDGNVIVRVTEQFQLEFLPAQHRPFHKHFVDGRSRESAVQCLIEELLAVDESAACSAECEGGADHQREPDLLSEFFTLEEGIGSFGGSHLDAHADHPLAELFAVFRFIDRLDIDTDQADVEAFPQTQFFGFLGQVQRSLPAHGGEHGIDLVFGKDLFDAVGGQR